MYVCMYVCIYIYIYTSFNIYRLSSVSPMYQCACMFAEKKIDEQQLQIRKAHPVLVYALVH